MGSVMATRRQSCRALLQGEIDLAGASSLRDGSVWYRLWRRDASRVERWCKVRSTSLARVRYGFLIFGFGTLQSIVVQPQPLLVDFGLKVL